MALGKEEFSAWTKVIGNWLLAFITTFLETKTAFVKTIATYISSLVSC